MSRESVIADYEQAVAFTMHESGLLTPEKGKGLYTTQALGRFVAGHEATLVLVTGASGSGKDSLKRAMIEVDPGFTEVQTATTRPWRGADQEAEDSYLWMEGWDPEMARDPEAIADMARAHDLIEYDINNPDELGRGHLYGVPRANIEAQARPIMDMYAGGVASMQRDLAASHNIRSVMTLVPDGNQLWGRLADGGREELEDRMRAATEQVEEGRVLVEVVAENPDARSARARMRFLAERVIEIFEANQTEETPTEEPKRKRLELTELRQPEFTGLLEHERRVYQKLAAQYALIQMEDAARIGEANQNSGGDWALDDDTVKASVETRDLNDYRMSDLPAWLKNESDLILPDPEEDGPISYGSRVTVDWGGGDLSTYDIMTRNHAHLPVDDENVETVVSGGSPLGQALMGAEVGSTVAYHIENTGSDVELEIVEVDQRAQAAFYEAWLARPKSEAV